MYIVHLFAGIAYFIGYHPFNFSSREMVKTKELDWLIGWSYWRAKLEFIVYILYTCWQEWLISLAVIHPITEEEQWVRTRVHCIHSVHSFAGMADLIGCHPSNHRRGAANQRHGLQSLQVPYRTVPVLYSYCLCWMSGLSWRSESILAELYRYARSRESFTRWSSEPHLFLRTKSDPVGWAKKKKHRYIVWIALAFFSLYV
jgi:hypothetical protein